VSRLEREIGALERGERREGESARLNPDV
jgi:hypothetical protein